MQKATVTHPCYPKKREGKHLAADNDDGRKSLPESRQRRAVVAATIVAEDRTSSLDSVHQPDQALHGGRHFTSTLSVTPACSGLGTRTRAKNKGREKAEGGDGDSEEAEERRRKKKRKKKMRREQVGSYFCRFSPKKRRTFSQ